MTIPSCILCMYSPNMKPQSASNIDSFIDMYIVDGNGRNVFGSACLNTHEIEVLELKCSRYVPFYDPKLFAAKGYVVNEDHSIRFYLNLPPEKKAHSYTYVRFDRGRTIRIKTEFITSKPFPSDHAMFGGGSVVKNKIWLDRTLIWETGSGQGIPTIDITKFH